MSQSDDLKKLLKAFEKRAHTSEGLDPWQELLSRRQTVASSKSAEAAEALQGFLGSWASAYGNEPLVKTSGGEERPEPSIPVPTTIVESRLGKSGLPEINFVPYSHRTNREGSKGPALLGHPISFSVVGPTLKDSSCDWQWEATDNSGIPGTGDYLTYDTTITGAPGPAAFEDGYGITSIPDDGLYLFISALGDTDGLIYTGGGRVALSEVYPGVSKSEIFRVVEISGNQLILDPGKRLVDYFNFLGNINIIRAVTIIKPKVSRLVPLPSGGPAGSERTFAVVSPESAANTDLLPPFDFGTSWLTLGGTADTYGAEWSLPIPVPSATENGDSILSGYLDNGTNGGPIETGLSRIVQISLPIGASFTAGDVGKVIHITNVTTPDSTTLENGEMKSILGWYEISEAGYTILSGIGNYLKLRRIPEVNPATGEKFFGPGPWTLTPEITVEFTIHKSISSLFTELPLDIDALDSCRLTNLIDPEWVKRSTKFPSSSVTPGMSWNRADRAIFDTAKDESYAANPGNLLDLGFRMVLFPARSLGGVVVPNFDKPINSREVILDPSITDEKQYIEIDYSGGIVRLSHTPVSGSDVAPNGIFTTANNPEGRLVLFASCIPYSMEKSQLGSGIRVTGGDVNLSVSGQNDLYSQKSFFPIIPGHTITLGGSIDFTVLDSENLFPPTGVVRVVDDPANPYVTGEGDYGYSGKTTAVVAPYGTVTRLSGIYPRPGATALPISPADGIAVLRRQPEVHPAADTTYGAAARTKTFRFAFADLNANADGSITVYPTAVGGPAEELRAPFPLGSADIGRVHLDNTTQNWTLESPVWDIHAKNEIGFEVVRGKVYSSFTHDFQEQDFYIKPFINRALSVSASNSGAADGSLRTNRYDLEIHDSTIPDLPAGFLNFLPETEILTGKLCVRIEGSTLSSSEVGTWGLALNERFGINVKKFADRSDRDSDDAKEVITLDEGPSNPVHWKRVEYTGTPTVAWFTSQINSYYTGAQSSSPAHNYLDERLFLTERQISILPSKCYLESAVLAAPISFPVETRYGLTLYSADPKHGYGNRWVSLVVSPMEFPLIAVDANVIAWELNLSFYEPVHPYQGGTLLDGALFFPTDSVPSPNPDLFAAGYDERQFLFIGPNDPRHPSGLNTVCLICGGFGSGLMFSSTRGRDFYNVMVEFHQTQGVAPLTADLGELLGGDFDTASNDQISRCGLFYGTDAYDTPVPPNTAVSWGPTNNLVNSLANTKLGFNQYGEESLGAVVGSFPIEHTDTGVNPNILGFEIPPGTANEYFKGPQRNTKWILSDGLIKNQEYQAIPILGPDGEALTGDNLEEAEIQFPTPPYLGRWVYHTFPRQVIDLTTPSAGGLAHIWVGYGSYPHDERGFVSPLTGITTGYRSFLVYAWGRNSQTEPPRLPLGSIKTGDLVLGEDPSGGPRTGREPAWEGFVLNNSAPEQSFSLGRDVKLTVMVSPRGYSADTDHIYPRSINFSSFGGVFSPLSLSESWDYIVSFVANASAITNSVAVSFLYGNRSGPSTFATDGFGAIQGPFDGSGLDGGSTTTLELAKSNAVVMSGGRINLLSLIGPTLPSGLTFSSPVLGSVDPSSGVRFANTYIESGVFTSSVSLSKAGIAGLDSAGIYDGFPKEDVGKTKGYQVGGVAGLRISGDAQVWLTDLKQMSSTIPTAVVRYSRFEPVVLQENAQTGPATLLGSRHIPSGFGAARSGDPDYNLVLQEATISIGLTRPDWKAFRAAVATPNWPSSNDGVYVPGSGTGNFLLMPNHAQNSEIPLPVRFLTGSYLKLGAPEFVVDPYYSVNQGLWRVVGTPLMVSGATPAAVYEDPQRYPYTPINPSLGEPHGVGVDAGTFNPGGAPASSVVAYIQVRVERFSAIPLSGGVIDPERSFAYETVGTETDGHSWAFYQDHDEDHPIYIAEVVDPGGSPTGTQRGLSGMTLDPGASGSNYGYFPMDLVSVFTDNRSYVEKWPLIGKGRLFGIHEVADNRGTIKSMAYFSMEASGAVSLSGDFWKAYARCTIYSSHRPDDRLDEFSQAETQGEFTVEKSGRVSFVGHPPRLGSGVLVDGGLGLLQATAIRIKPQSGRVDKLGALAVFGQGSYPFSDYTTDKSNRGTRIASTFNETEFYDNTIIVGPAGRLVFENGRAAQGLPYNLREISAASNSTLSPIHLSGLRNGENPRGRIVPNDTLFPYGASGIRFKMPGTVVYERPYRSIEGTGDNVILGSWKGASGPGGIKGLEIPLYGECLLLPKGPPNANDVEGPADFKSSPFGFTPLDLPLYEFTNGLGIGPVNWFFPIIPAPVFDEAPIGGHLDAGIDAHKVQSGSVHQGYRHTHSREDGSLYGSCGVRSADLDMPDQMRLLDGMVLEDIDNGTFYTVGSIGHWKDCVLVPGQPLYISGSLGQVGSANVLGKDRSSVNGSMVCSSGGHQYAKIEISTYPPTIGQGIQLLVSGVLYPLRYGTEFSGGSVALACASMASYINSWVPGVLAYHGTGNTYIYICLRRVGYFDDAQILRDTLEYTITPSPGAPGLWGNWYWGDLPEIIYDIGPHTDKTLLMQTNLDNGYGDRVDNDRVRRPLHGHKFRVTPNVEFVPVLGPRGVNGGLLPPKQKPSGDYIEGADAIFYTTGVGGYEFKRPGDIGRFVYLCGTYTYHYTGWWLIIDVIEDYPVVEGAITQTHDVAVLRKWNRGADWLRQIGESPFPVCDRAPIIRMASDFQTNDGGTEPGYFGVTPPGNLYLGVTDSAGAYLWESTVAAPVADCVALAALANANNNFNGINVPLVGGPASGDGKWITWAAEVNGQYPLGVNVQVSYNLQKLSVAQKAQVLGEKAVLRVQFYTNLDTGPIPPPNVAPTHTAADGPLAVGFYSYTGANSQVDRCTGDRNNSAQITNVGFVTPYSAYSAAKGLRWVFSSPLTEEYVGSYLHIQKPALYRFGIELNSQIDLQSPPDRDTWTDGWSRVGDDEDLLVDIFRINRCPNTGHLVLGGDCEVYFPEIISANNQKGKPLLYSPLSVMGVWPDSETGELPSTGSLNTPIMYTLQPIARERILTVSPRNASSNTMIAHGGELVTGPYGSGLGPYVSSQDYIGGAADILLTNSFDLSKPWLLTDRTMVTRTRLAEDRIALNGWPLSQYGAAFSDNPEIFNSNSEQPISVTIPVTDSDYTWAPAGEWWQLWWPTQSLSRDWQYNASKAPPTLRVDLTDLFTQAIQPGGGINSPFPGKAPKGARLNRIWVNFGLWPHTLTSITRDSTPGYIYDALEENAVLDAFYMSFNLILEIPGSQRQGPLSGQHPLGSGTCGLPFGDRAPTASFSHGDNSGDEGYPGGTIVVPLYVNREAGDLMPNVMERWVDAGPRPKYNSAAGNVDPTPDWMMGDYEHGFGCISPISFYDLYDRAGSSPLLPASASLICNSHNPILWGGIDNGPFTSGEFSRVLSSPFMRHSRVSGGVRSTFTSGLVPDGKIFKKVLAESLSASAMTGIVVAHAGESSSPAMVQEGGFSFGNRYSASTCGHAFTIALTPVGDFWEPPKDGSGNKIPVDWSTPIPEGDDRFPFLGRRLQTINSFEPKDRPFKVGNWLDNILDRYGIAVPSGSMLPPGARVYLEVATGPGPSVAPAFSSVLSEKSAGGSWVGSVKCAFEVETADGTAYTENVNHLNED